MEKIKCVDCPYYYIEERNEKEDVYGFCCYYNQTIDRVCILQLCKFLDYEGNDEIR